MQEMSSVPEQQPGTVIFLSHAGEETANAKELAHQLRQAGVEVWLDVERLKPGDRWMEKIEEGLREASALVVYVGRSGVRNWVDNEVRVALDRSTKDPSFRLIPVLGPKADPESLPLFLKQYQWTDLRQGVDQVGHLKKLLATVTEKPPEQVSLLPPGTAPFRGLSFFDVEDALLFYGRDQEISELLEKLRVDTFLALVGDSGSGKSSLVRAGLIPALYRGRFYDSTSWVQSWRVAITRPGKDPFGELAEALPDLNPGMSPAQKTEFLKSIRTGFSDGVHGLRDGIAGLVPRETHTLLVVDQFEELFTLTSNEEERRRFIDSLFHAARSETTRPVHVLITLRADFYSHCWQHSRLRKRLPANQYNVGKMDLSQLQEVIEKPLALAGARAETGLVDAILSDVGDEPGNLPLLEHALLQLWERRDAKSLTHKAYSDIGRLSGALKNHADQVYENLRDVHEQDLARMIFLSLTRLGDNTEDTRHRLRKIDLMELGEDNKATERVLKTLTDSRLIMSSGEATREIENGDAVVEVAHEALIREWPKLREWVEDSRDSLRFRQRLVQAAQGWDSSPPEVRPDLLWRGKVLEQAVDWAQEQEAGLPNVAKEFLKASQTEVIFEDKETGLMWTPNDNGRDVDWDQANQHAEALSLAGYTDWRLPTIDELETLYDFETEEGLKIRKSFRLTGRWVWSSTKEGSDSAWDFNFSNGNRLHNHLAYSSYYRALCVRRSGD